MLDETLVPVEIHTRATLQQLRRAIQHEVLQTYPSDPKQVARMMGGKKQLAPASYLYRRLSADPDKWSSKLGLHHDGTVQTDWSLVRCGVTRGAGIHADGTRRAVRLLLSKKDLDSYDEEPR
jgi:hypothetical protein